jgi:hypothetical protein
VFVVDITYCSAVLCCVKCCSAWCCAVCVLPVVWWHELIALRCHKESWYEAPDGEKDVEMAMDNDKVYGEREKEGREGRG